MKSESVKVCDAELKQLAEVAACWDEINSVLAEYVSIMDNCTKDAVKSGHIHEAVASLAYYARKFQTYADGLGGTASGKIKGLASKIDEIDLNLYNS